LGSSCNGSGYHDWSKYFFIFGVGAKIAGNNLPEASVLSGIFALIVAYSYAKLGSKIISNAGPIAFYQWQTQRGAFYGTLITLLGALILEYVYRYLKNRRFLR